MRCGCRGGGAYHDDIIHIYKNNDISPLEGEESSIWSLELSLEY
jgi:hypothetical protein